MARKPAKRRPQPTTATLRLMARRRVKLIVSRARHFSELRRRAPGRAWEVEVSLVGPALMTRLNSHYRRKKYATDVLSFDAPEAFRAGGVLGDLVICASVLKRQAREQGHSADTELQILLAHGLLHLLGFDHERGERAAREMQRWEAKILGPRAAARALIARNR